MAYPGRRNKITKEQMSAFAMAVLEDIWGGPLPDKLKIKPLKCLARGIRRLPEAERHLWSRCFTLPLSLDRRLKSAAYQWVRRFTKSKALEFCGFTIAELKLHIEQQFEPWMSWDNWGEWHIDHIIPRSRYGKTHSRSEVFGLQNLRPLHRLENMAKGDRLV